MRILVVSLLSIVVVGALAVGAVVVFVLPDDGEKASPEEEATMQRIEQLQLVFAPAVWRQIVRQPWFAGGKTGPDGMRLMEFLADYYLAQRPPESLLVLEAYPHGLGAEMERALVALKSDVLIRAVAPSPWFIDGISEPEATFLDVLTASWSRSGAGWTFNQVMFDSLKAAWFSDGIDEKEGTIVGAAGALSSRDQQNAIQLIKGLESNAYISDDVELSVSGTKTVIVTSAPGILEDRLQPSLDLVKRWIGAVEDFVGPYQPRYILVSVEELAPSLCGTGSGHRGDVPGFVTLHLACVQDSTVVHELAHVFVATGPIWFAEGLADLVVLHVTGRTGNYLARQTTGRISVNARRQPGEISSPTILNQGALGAKFMVEVYRLIGAERTSEAIKDVTAGKWAKEGPLLLDLFLEKTPDELKPRMSALYAERFESIR